MEECAEEEIPRKKYSSPKKKSTAKEVTDQNDVNPRFQQLINELNAFKSI